MSAVLSLPKVSMEGARRETATRGRQRLVGTGLQEGVRPAEPWRYENVRWDVQALSTSCKAVNKLCQYKVNTLRGNRMYHV
jgi:hypothetical protein